MIDESLRGTGEDLGHHGLVGMRNRVAVLAGVVVLSACTGGSGKPGNTSVAVAPVVSATPSASVSPTDTLPPIPTTGPNVLPGATVPVLPEAAKQHTAHGAFAFAASLAPALDWAYSTVDSAILKQFYGAECKGCIGSLETFDSAKLDSLTFSGSHISLLKLTQRKAVPADAEGTYAFDETLSATPLTVKDRTGKIVEGPYPASRVTLRYGVSWTGSRWTVSSSTRLIGGASP